jgi:hypothetical protein
VKKVAIVGSEESTRDNAPYDDLSYEIWSFADWLTSAWLRRLDALIEIHSAVMYMNHPRTPEYWDALQKTDIPVWMYPIADPRVKSAKLYPLNEVLSLCKGTNSNKLMKLLNCSLVYALGLAILQEYEVIDVYGVELAHETKYGQQRHAFSFWAGLAMGRGIEVNVHCSEGLFHQPLYGIETGLETTKAQAYMEIVKQQMEEAERAKLKTQGALMILEKLVYGDKIHG